MPRVSEQSACGNPRVSVHLVTYNHERFISQAIESVLMQETDFTVELIIGEDCSTDGTRLIVKAYAEKYPKVIRALFPDMNLGAARNHAAVLQACRGDCVAFLEGDDYWTAPDKLQRQMELMETNPGMALCHHTVNYVSWEGGSRKVLKTFPDEADRGLRQAADLIGRNFIQTSSLMVRRSFLPPLDADFQRLKLGDWPLCYLAAERGGIGFVDSTMADYRIHENNAWNSLETGTREFETARMAFYLASVARREAQPYWFRYGLFLMSSVLESQPTFTGAGRKAFDIWRSGSLPFPRAIQLFAGNFRKRAVAGLRRHPRLLAALKRVLRPWTKPLPVENRTK
jgi:glycosyltransferase involved in cell wall biosynthesis